MNPTTRNGRATSLLAGADVRKQRLATCASCPHRKIQPLTKIAVCGQCGCPLASKTRLSRAACPIGKW